MGIYSVKLIEYQNGICEMRTYSEPVGNKPVNMPDELLIAKQQVARIHNQLQEHTVYNPFEDVEMEMYDYDEMEMYARRKEHSARNSYSRTVQQIYKYARQCEWEYFITLTFKKEVVDRYDYGKCMRMANQWFKNQHKRYAPNLQYIVVPERHQDGAWHIHGLLAKCGNMVFADSGHLYGERTIYNLEGWRFGFSTAVPVLDTRVISGYITKYITKELCDITDGKRRYYRSKNIPEPKETEYLVEGDLKGLLVQALAQNFEGKLECFEHRKKIEGYTSVEYGYSRKENDNR